ncbi:MAG TPA: ABC transporter permease [Pyrinomonadaceae bacterium]|nr:ABC transporter permease [Pyrinomonadaceae bacterium]
MGTLLKDLRYGLRMLAKTPAFTVVAVLSLALGIGANTTVFSLMDAVMLRSLPVQQPEQIVEVATLVPNNPPHYDFSYPLYAGLRDNNQSLSGLIAYSTTNLGLTAGDRTERIRGELVSANYFSVLGVQPTIGSAFAPSDETPGAPRAALISDALWTRFFNRDPNVLNKTISLNGRSFSVVGVAPKKFSGMLRGMATDVWVTLPHGVDFENHPKLLSSANLSWLLIAGRLKPGVAIQQAQTQLTSLLPGLLPEGEAGNQSIVLKEAAGGNSAYVADLSRPVTLLFLAVALILAIACANVASLLLARARTRGKEIGVRLALGATRFRIVRQLLTESLLLALAGGALGLLCTFWTSGLVSGLLTTTDDPLLLETTPNARVLVFTLLASVATVLLFGVAPALKASRVDLVPTLKDSNATTPIFRRGPALQSLLVITQIALSLVLLAGAGLFVRSLWKLQGIDKGFSGGNVMAFSLNMDLQGYDKARGANFYAAALEDLSSVPGIESVTLANSLPATAGGRNMQMGPNETKPAVNEKVSIDIVIVAPRFFETTGLPLLQGRDFRRIDNEKTANVMIVNETMARKFWGQADPVGQSFNDGRDTYEVVGVARDTKYRNLRETPRMTMYQPLTQAYVPTMNLLIRTPADPTTFVGVVQRRLNSIEPAITVYNVRTLLEHVGRSLYVERMESIILGTLGLLALILTAIGVYGVVTYSVTQRTRELGIRMALGAQRGDVFRLVLRKGLILVVWGSALGLLACYWLARLISSQLYGISPNDPATLLSVAVILVGVALLASYIPARRATKVDPLVALRYE